MKMSSLIAHNRLTIHYRTVYRHRNLDTRPNRILASPGTGEFGCCRLCIVSNRSDGVCANGIAGTAATQSAYSRGWRSHSVAGGQHAALASRRVLAGAGCRVKWHRTDRVVVSQTRDVAKNAHPLWRHAVDCSGRPASGQRSSMVLRSAGPHDSASAVCSVSDRRVARRRWLDASHC